MENKNILYIGPYIENADILEHPISEYFKFAVVRNPWDRVVSCYEYAKMEESYWHATKGKARAGKHLDYDLLKDCSFENCLDILKNTPQKLRHQGWANQSNYIYNGSKLMVDYV